jgi:hypothetical protein
MQLSTPFPRRHKVLMSFDEKNGFWFVVFWDTDRRRAPLPRKARFTTNESMIEFARRAGGIRMQEDRQIFDLMIQRKSGEITLELTDDQYEKLESMTKRKIKHYKPIKFGDGPDPGTVEGHRKAMAEAAETRAYNRRMRELAAKDEAKRESLLSKITNFFTSKSRRF